jgi:hypothetical protein
MQLLLSVIVVAVGVLIGMTIIVQVVNQMARTMEKSMSALELKLEKQILNSSQLISAHLENARGLPNVTYTLNHLTCV